jgi:hypothetical protein
MIASLKKTRLGKAIHHLSRRPVIGCPIRMISRFVQSEVFQPAHLHPANIAHNRREARILRQFESNLK